MVKNKQWLHWDSMKMFIYVLLFGLILPMCAGAVEERYPLGHPDQGLPHPDFVLTPYHEDPSHVLNRIFRASFLVTTFPDAEAIDFVKLLEEMNGEVLRALKGRPELAVFFQDDLLRLAERLMETGHQPGLLRQINTVVKKVALPFRQLFELPLTYVLGLKFGSIDLNLPLNLLCAKPATEERYAELLRQSTRLFNVSHSHAWSRVFIRWPHTFKGLIDFLSAQSKGARGEVPYRFLLKTNHE